MLFQIKVFQTFIKTSKVSKKLKNGYGHVRESNLTTEITVWTLLYCKNLFSWKWACKKGFPIHEFLKFLYIFIYLLLLLYSNVLQNCVISLELKKYNFEQLWMKRMRLRLSSFKQNTKAL